MATDCKAAKRGIYHRRIQQSDHLSERFGIGFCPSHRFSGGKNYTLACRILRHYGSHDEDQVHKLFNSALK